MTQIAESQAKRHKSYFDFERERDKSFIEFKKMEAEKNRQHKLQIVHISASATMSEHSNGPTNACNSSQYVQPMNTTYSYSAHLMSPPRYSTMGLGVLPPYVSKDSPGHFQQFHRKFEAVHIIRHMEVILINQIEQALQEKIMMQLIVITGVCN